MEKNIFSLSTAWNVQRHTDGRQMIREILGLGFNHVELSFNLTHGQLEGIKEEQKNGRVVISSIHNYCPVPDVDTMGKVMPDYYSFSSPDEDERKKSVALTKSTIDLARDLNAPAIILHCGNVDMSEGSGALARLHEKGMDKGEYYKRVKFNLLVEREKKSKPYLDKLMLSMDELCPYAEGKGIKLGIENRYSIREIPSLEELGLLLKNFRLYYWHDVGHAQYFENLDLINHQEYMDRYSEYLLGLHLHDINGSKDHKVPGQGKFDFKRIQRYLKNDIIRVLEIHSPATGKEVQGAVKYLTNLYKN